MRWRSTDRVTLNFIFNFQYCLSLNVQRIKVVPSHVNRLTWSSWNTFLLPSEISDKIAQLHCHNLKKNFFFRYCRSFCDWERSVTFMTVIVRWKISMSYYSYYQSLIYAVYYDYCIVGKVRIVFTFVVSNLCYISHSSSQLSLNSYMTFLSSWSTLF